MKFIIFTLTGLVVFNAIKAGLQQGTELKQTIEQKPQEQKTMTDKLIESLTSAIGKITRPRSLNFANVNKFDDIIRAAAAKHGLPFVVIKGLVATESGFRPDAVPRNSQGKLLSSARGLMQMTKAAAEEVGFDHGRMFEPEQGIMAGAAYLKKQVDRFGLWGGVRAYYEGPGNRSRNSDDISTNDNPTRAAESATYASKVGGYAVAFLADVDTWKG